MTIAELIAELGKYDPDTSVRAVISDEFSVSPAVDIGAVTRVLNDGVPYVELSGEL